MRAFTEYASRVDEALKRFFSVRHKEALMVGEIPPLLYRSMGHSLLSGGKRVRGALMLAAADMLGGEAKAIPFAMAVEMIHASSLIHDDMPCMDNDVLRRGMPTNHVVFGEGQALLAGDGLLNMAYETMLDHATDKPSVDAAYEIAKGAGVTGMMAGQCIDLMIEGTKPQNEEEVLYFIQANKTAAMFKHPLRAMGKLQGGSDEIVENLGEYGLTLGLLFQVTDDLLDEEGDETLGKSLHKDAASGKLTSVSVYGLNGARARAAGYLSELIKIAGRLTGGEAFFTAFAEQMAARRT